AMAEVSASDAPTEGTKYGSGSSTGAPDYPHGTRRDPKYTKLRGNIYHFRMRCPKRYRGYYSREFIDETLRTDSRTQAEALALKAKNIWMEELKVRASREQSPNSAETFKALTALAKNAGLQLVSVDQLAHGSLDELLTRINGVQVADPKAESALFAATLGGFEAPKTTILEAANQMEIYRPQDISGKNKRQKTHWINKFKRAANGFSEVASDKPIVEIKPADAKIYLRYWQRRVDDGGISSDYAKKHLGYLRAIINSFYEFTNLDEYQNPFEGTSSIKKRSLLVPCG
ncbi:DUF6538 domain-containing protein, partial [Roseovarius sp. D0-M9]|uniref:DUF6538 domain-containing protein n=1 Tax=Roseovarius sp. D0-M9 TaxID=3127117 RepID=UPI00300FF91B